VTPSSDTESFWISVDPYLLQGLQDLVTASDGIGPYDGVPAYVVINHPLANAGPAEERQACPIDAVGIVDWRMLVSPVFDKTGVFSPCFGWTTLCLDFGV
jgi:hypothetical protein